MCDCRAILTLVALGAAIVSAGMLAYDAILWLIFTLLDLIL